MTGPVVLNCITYLSLLTLNTAAVRLFENTATWENAVIECKSKSANIEMDFDTITKLNIPDGTEFWLPKYTAVTPWIDIIGCYNKEDLNPYKTINTTSVGICQEVCGNTNVTYFGLNKQSCICVQNAILEVRSRICQKNSISDYIIYTVTEQTYANIGDGLCRIGKCYNQSPKKPTYVPYTPITVKCQGTDRRKSICRNGQGRSFTPSKNDSQSECKNYHGSFLPFLNPTFCAQYPDETLTYFWLSTFRTRYDRLHSYTKQKPVPISLISCKYGFIINGTHHERDGDCLKFKHVICHQLDVLKTTGTTKRTVMTTFHSAQLDKSTDVLKTTETTKRTVMTTSHSAQLNKSTEFSTGAIVGTAFCAVIFIVAVTVLGIWIRTRRLKNSHENGNHEVHYSKDTYGNRGTNNRKENKNSTLKLENGSVKNTSTDIYAVVNKKDNKPKPIVLEETYLDAPSGEYDSLNSVGNRRILPTYNVYDSNLGIRNEVDPTYFTSNFECLNADRGSDVYDHSFAATGKYNDNLYSAAFTVETVK